MVDKTLLNMRKYIEGYANIKHRKLYGRDIRKIDEKIKEYKEAGGKVSPRSIVGRIQKNILTPRANDLFKTNQKAVKNKQALYEKISSFDVKGKTYKQLLKFVDNKQKVKKALGDKYKDVKSIYKKAEAQKNIEHMKWVDQTSTYYYKRSKTLNPYLHTGKRGRPNVAVTKKEQAKQEASVRKTGREAVRWANYLATHPERQVPVTINGKTTMVSTTHQGISAVNVDNTGIHTEFRRYQGWDNGASKWAPRGVNKYSFTNIPEESKANLNENLASVVSGTGHLGKFVNDLHATFDYKQTYGLKKPKHK